MSDVWVWIEHKDGQAASVSWEALGLARRLADEQNVSVVALAFGPSAAQAAQEAIEGGAERALVCEAATLSEQRVEPHAGLLSTLAAARPQGLRLPGATHRGTDPLR